MSKRKHYAYIVGLLGLLAITGTLCTSPRPPRTPSRDAAAVPADPVDGSPLQGGFRLAESDPGITARLNRLIYRPGDEISVSITLAESEPDDALTHPVLIAAPESGDVELLPLRRSAGRALDFAGGVLLGSASDVSAVTPYDGTLHARPGEALHAVWLVDRAASDALLVTDIGLTADDSAIDVLPMDVAPELALLEESTAADRTDKPYGTLLIEGAFPVQVALHELIFVPRNPADLDAFLAESNGRVLATDVLPAEAGERAPRYYLVRVDTSQADLFDVPQLRAFGGQTGALYGSSEDTLRLLSLALRYRLEGYRVAVNPRLQFAGVPGISDVEEGNVLRNMTSNGPLNVPELWAYMALWDKDENRVPIALLDIGFAPNNDYRPILKQCDLEGDDYLEAISSGMECGPGVAVGPPTVGGSLFGGLSWHGNGIASASAGIVNNGWGAAGVGGQVGQPMLYRYGLASYAFEIGLGIRQAALDGASVINLSAAYPCTIVTSLDLSLSYCTPGDRIGICAAATIGLNVALELICATSPALAQIPVVGPALAAGLNALCGVARPVVNVASAVCFSSVLLGDLRGNMEEAVAFAAERGVPFVTVAGNRISASSLPEEIRDLVDLDNAVTDDWNIMPAMSPGAIVAGAARDDWPFDNIHFYGPRVDIWAPIRSAYFAPPTTDEVVGSDQQVRRSVGGTSAAAPYISGLIAAMQAANPELNPNTPGLTGAQRRAIVPRIKALLKDNAWTVQELIDLASSDWKQDVADAADERRNLVNPLRTIRAAGEGFVPDIEAMGYDAGLDFDETTAAAAADTEATARLLLLEQEHAGTIVTLRGEGGAPDLSDADWYRYQVPVLPLGSFRATFHLRMPSGSGVVRTDTPGYSIVKAVPPSPAEDLYVITSPEILAGDLGAFRILSAGQDDNVYKVKYVHAVFTDSLTRPIQLPLGRPVLIGPIMPGQAAPIGVSVGFGSTLAVVPSLPHDGVIVAGTLPDQYRLHWEEPGPFQADFRTDGDASLRVRLRELDGAVLAEAATLDLVRPGGRSADDLPSPVLRDAALQSLRLEVADLAAGEYLIEISHARPGTEIRVSRP